MLILAGTYEDRQMVFNLHLERSRKYLIQVMHNDIGMTTREIELSVEQRVSRLVGKGLSKSEIATRLDIEASRYEDM